MNSKLVTRAGSNPRVICYSMSFSPRKLEFLDPPKQQKPAELKGNFKAKVHIERRDKVRQFKKFLLPDTYRTTNHVIDPLSQTSTSNFSTRINSPGNLTSLINKGEVTPQKSRIQNRRNFMSSVMEQDPDMSFNVLNNTSKREIRQTPLNYYTSTTQIVALPGGVKRDSSLIADNQNYIDPRLKSPQSSTSYAYKVTRDYRTNVSCLPANSYNINIRDLDMPDDRSVGKYKNKYSMENSDYNIISPNDKNLNKSVCGRITNIKVVNSNNQPVRHQSLKGETNNANYSLFNSSSKRLLNVKNVTSDGIERHRPMKKSISRRDLMTTSEEKRLIESSKGKKPGFVKDAFRSQIELV